jgi:SAM-dependent methyltransferase
MTTRVATALRKVLLRASYDERSVKELVCVDGLDLGRGLLTLPLRPSAHEPLGRLVRLFLARDDLHRDDATAAVAPVTLAELEAAGIVEGTAGRVRALVRLDPVGELIVASDPRPPGRLPPDHVVSPGPASETLAALTIRTPAAVALDLCCGSGVQALLAAKHTDRVVATDLNPRALRLATLSAALSDIDTVEWRLGDLFDPVGDARFDLIVANPPFVISPAHDLAFRDGGRPGDELSHTIVTGVAARLHEGGLGHVLCSWVRAEGAHWSDTPRSWLASGLGCDAVILHLDTASAITYAFHWTSLDAPTSSDAVNQASGWIDYYRTLGITHIATGLVVLRRRNGRNWVHAEELTAAGREAGVHLARIFAGHDLLAGLATDRALLELSLTFAPGVSLVERWSQGGELERARLTLQGGVQLPGRITPPGAASALLGLDGKRTLIQAGAVANVAPAELEAALPALHELVRRGYLVIGDDG